MKIFFIFISMFILSGSYAFGKIKNGYESQIQNAEISLRDLNLIMTSNKNLSAPQHRIIKSRINLLVKYIAYFKLTEKLIGQFKIVSPELFEAMDTIADRKGRPVDIYIKFISIAQATVRQPGATFFAQGLNDPDENCSEYGAGSVSVEIWLMDNALPILAHEFGHIQYIAPRLANYVPYHKANYSLQNNQTGYMGHSAHDPSGKSAVVFQDIFLSEYRDYIRNGGDHFKVASMLNRKTREEINHESKNYYAAKSLGPSSFRKDLP